MNRRSFFYFLLLLLFLFPTYSIAQEHQQCLLCGMDLNKYSHTRYTLTTVDGQEISTCGVQCGLLMQINLGKNFHTHSAIATDLLSHKPIPAEKAWYVYRSVVVTDMSPGFIAFASKDYATRFVKGFGGKVLTFQQSLNIVQGGFK